MHIEMKRSEQTKQFEAADDKRVRQQKRPVAQIEPFRMPDAQQADQASLLSAEAENLGVKAVHSRGNDRQVPNSLTSNRLYVQTQRTVGVETVHSRGNDDSEKSNSRNSMRQWQGI